MEYWGLRMDGRYMIPPAVPCPPFVDVAVLIVICDDDGSCLRGSESIPSSTPSNAMSTQNTTSLLYLAIYPSLPPSLASLSGLETFRANAAATKWRCRHVDLGRRGVCVRRAINSRASTGHMQKSFLLDLG